MKRNNSVIDIIRNRPKPKGKEIKIMKYDLYKVHKSRKPHKKTFEMTEDEVTIVRYCSCIDNILMFLEKEKLKC